jgi:tRNA A-37 threonylcarbamoyl transferase component Bud32
LNPDAPTEQQAGCPKCGRPTFPGDSACRHCGAGLPSAPTVATPPDAPTAPAPGASDALAAELREALAPGIQLLHPLGAGGMGHVWLARDPALKRLVAVKVLHPELANDPTSRARFAREAEAAAAVSHPGVVSVYQVGELPRSGTTYFVMQYVEGKSLQDTVKPGEAMPETRVRRIVGEIASALAAAHARGLVHRDIKPANVMLDGESGRVVVVDFGISAAMERRTQTAATRLTAEGHSIGTPEYMSPEQAAAADVTAKSDAYSLGVLAFELAAGQLPFTGQTSMELVAAHIKDIPPRLSSLRPDFDPHLAELIDRCLAKDPARRPAAADVAKALQPAAHSVIEWPPPGLEPLRGQGAEVAAMMSTAAGVGLVYFLTLRTQPLLVQPLWYVERFLAFDGTPIWYFTLGLCLLVLVLLVPLTTVRAWQLADRLRLGRRSSYPWRVLLDVAWDQRTDTGALLNGSGAYALVDPAERRKILELRRRRAFAAAGTIAVATLSPLVWLTGWTGGWAENRGPLLPGPEVLALFLPVLAGLVLLWWWGRPEARLHARLGLGDKPASRDRSTVRPELVAAWLAASGTGPASRRTLPRAVLVVVPAALLAVLLVGAATVLAVAFSASRALSDARDEARTVVQSMRVDSLRPIPWQRVDSILGAAARLPDTRPEADLEAAKLVLSASFVGGSPSPALIADSNDVKAWPDEDPRAGGLLLATSIMRRLPSPAAEADVERLAADTLTPRLAPWRRLARSGRLPMLWPYRSGLPGVRHHQEGWGFPGTGLDQGGIPLAWRNSGAAVLAMARGDKSAAVTRVRENIAVGRLIMGIPVRNLNWSGRVIIDQSARYLVDIGRVSGDPVISAEGERIRATLGRLYEDDWPWAAASRALAADPVGAGILAYLADTTLAPFTRIRAAEATVSGFCFNARELLFGVDARRREALRAAGSALSDLVGAADLVRLMGNDLEALIADPAGVAGSTGVRPRVLWPMGWLFPSLQGRLAYCFPKS